MSGKKKKVLVITSIVSALILIGVIAILFFTGKSENNGRDEFQGFGQNGMAGMMNMSVDVVTASGSTSVGMDEETFELDFIETELIVEEVYLSSQQEVTAGTAILKLTDESIEDARRELKEKAIQAELDYRQAVLDSEQEKITAEQTLKTSQTEKNYADYTMQETLKKYQDEIDSLNEQIVTAQELVDEYTASLQDDYYYTYYEVEEKKEAYTKAYETMIYLDEFWDIETLEEREKMGSGSGSSMGNSMGGGMSGGMGSSVSGNSADESSKLTVFEMLEEELEENLQAYEKAVEDYETAKAKAEVSFNQAVYNLQLLMIRLEEAQIEYDKQKVSAQSKYDSTVSTGNQAQTTWGSEMERIEEELSLALSEKEDAEENLAEFEETIGNGILYTQNEGTVLMVMAREENALNGGGMVLAYSNPQSVTVNASVAQEDIAKVEVGESAIVIFSEYGTFEGRVASVNPISNSNGRSSVTYSVMIELSGDVSTLSQNLSATVYIGASMNDVPVAEGGENRNEERPEMSGERPEGRQPGMPEAENREGE